MDATGDALSIWLGTHGSFVPHSDDEADERASIVDGLYHDVLQRQPDPPGLHGMVQRMQSGLSAGDARQQLLGSAEAMENSLVRSSGIDALIARFGSMTQAIQDRDGGDAVDVFAMLEVVACYLVLLGRWPDRAGLLHYYDERRDQRPLIDVIRDLHYTDEARAASGTSAPNPDGSTFRDVVAVSTSLLVLRTIAVQHAAAAVERRPSKPIEERDPVEVRLERIERLLTLMADQQLAVADRRLS